MGLDGDGLAGLELEYKTLLGGTAGSRVAGGRSRAASRSRRASSSETPPVPGSDVVTTIDRELQYQVQQALEAAVKANAAQGRDGHRDGPAHRRRPRDGDLPVVRSRTIHGLRHARLDEIDRNRAVTDAFEPGSVNKVITASAAVQEHAVPLDERLSVAWSMQVGGSVIHDAASAPASSA